MAVPTLRDRAKGPRRNADEYCCPWCGAACFDRIADCIAETDAMQPETVGTCTSCGREFLCRVETARFVVIGLRSPADLKYQAQRQAQVAA